MKSFSINRYHLSFFICFIFLNSCNLFHKNVDPSLPPITMEGKNTFGCLVNGNVWLPKGDLFVPAISADYTSRFLLGFGASHQSTEPSDFFFSLKNPVSNKVYSLKDTSVAKAVFDRKLPNQTMSCIYEAYHVFDGSLTITKFDTKKGIVSGTFQFSTYNPSCGDTIKVTQGRFDIGDIAF